MCGCTSTQEHETLDIVHKSHVGSCMQPVGMHNRMSTSASWDNELRCKLDRGIAPRLPGNRKKGRVITGNYLGITLPGITG